MRSNVRDWLKTRQGRRCLWATVVLAVYALTGFVLVPWILVKVIPKKAAEFLQREVTVDRICINPFVLSGSLQGLKVKDMDGSVLLSWDEVYGNFQLSSIFHRAFTFKEVRVVKPYVHLQIQPDYSLNISDILQRSDESSKHTPPDDEQGIPALRVNRLLVTNAVAHVSDLTLRKPFHRQIGPVAVILKDFRTHPDNETPYAFEGSTEAGERFSWNGRFSLFPLRSEGEFEVQNVNIRNYSPFYQDFVSLEVEDGVIDLSSAYRLHYDGTNNVLAVSNAAFHLASLKVKAGMDSTENALEVGDLRVSGVEADLWERNARVESVVVEGGELVVRRNRDSTVNLLEMAQPSDTNAQPAGAVLYAMKAMTNLISTFLTTTNQAVAAIDNLDVNDWTLELRDDAHRRPVHLRIDDIKVHARNLSNVPGEDLSLGVECRWNTNGTIKVDAGATLFPIHSDVTLQVDRVELPALDPYLEPFASVLLLDGKLSMNGVIRIRREAMGAPFDLEFEGGLNLDDFSSVDALMGTDLLEWKSVQLSAIQANLHPMELRVGEIAIHDATDRLVVETNRTINVLNAMHVGDTNPPGISPRISDGEPKPALSSPTPSNEAGGLQEDLGLPALTVSSVVISNAALDLTDASTQPPLHWEVTQVNGQVGSLSSASGERADLRLTARAGGAAPVEILGKLNPLNPALDTDITVKLDGMDLLPFSPYSGRYAGYRLRQGSLSLDLQYNVQGRKLTADNLIVLDQLSLGQKVDSPDATKLPVKLGVAVLKDRNGVINLDIPIEGNLDDPEFRLGRVIGHTIMITLTKTLSSPFALLGSIVGGTGEELSSFDFLPGSSTVQLSETNGLHKLAVALYERPGLEVEIQGSVAPESDGLAIKKQKLTRELQQIRWTELRDSAQADIKPEEIILSPDLRIAMLRKYYVQVFPEEARSSKAPPGLEDTFYERMTNKLLDQLDATEEDLQRLAQARAHAVKAWLIERGNVEPARLFLPESKTALNEGSKVLLQLQ